MRRGVGVAALAMALMMTACSSLLPKAETATQAPWGSFDEAMRMFDRIETNRSTLADLKAMGIDPYVHPNITIVDYAELTRRYALPGVDTLSQFEPALVRCLKGRERCRGYQIVQQEIHRDRIGNFWLDLFGFRHLVKTTGWRFSAMLVLDGDTVVYKVWSGEPLLHEIDDERNPLGPLQGIGPALVPSVR
jgi:hypothetical protein